MKKKILLFVLVLVSFHVFGQIPEHVQPPSWKLTSVKKSTTKPFELPPFDLKKMQAEDLINDQDKSKPWRFGYKHFVHHDSKQMGEWTTLPNGDRIWRMHYTSKGAYTLNFIFERFKIPKGAKLYVYSDDKKDLIRPFTHFNNNEQEILGTWPVEGNHAWIEYYQPASVKGDHKLTIGSVVHGYRTAASYQKALGDSGDCNQDVDCDITPPGTDTYGINTVKENVKKSAGMIVVNGDGNCSGALVNNTNNDGKPYFLTANHCSGGEGTWAFRFNWRSPTPSCSTTASSPDGSYNQTVSGAVRLASSSQSDMELVEITDPSFFTNNPDLVWAGWNRSTSTVPNVNFSIHHPSGDIQKVCREDDGAYRAVVSFNGNPNTQMWYIDEWELGVTEPGSSGSPLFNELGQVIGMLSGGLAACSGTSNNGQYDFYGRFGVAWDFGSDASSRLEDWLDPIGTNPEVLDQFPPLQTYSYDARTTLGAGLQSEICNEDFTPTINIINAGTEVLTSATVSYHLDADADTVVNWTGSLAQNESDVINVPTYTNLAEGDHTFTVTVSNPNNNADENTSNDINVFNFKVSNDYGTSTVIFNITTDNYGEETTWELRDSADNIVDSGPNTSYDDNTDYQETIVIPNFGECYVFTILDSENDGICCGFGTGSYNLEDESGNVIISGGDFGAEESVTFSVSDPLGVDDFNLGEQVKIIPNPVSDVFDVRLGDIEQAEYTLSNALGQTIATGSLTGNTTNAIDISRSASGLYFLSIRSGKLRTVQKVLKK